MTPDLAQWVPLAVMALALTGSVIRFHSTVAKMETKSLADKLACDTSLALLRAEMVVAKADARADVASAKAETSAVEARAVNRHNEINESMRHMNDKLDRIVESVVRRT